MANCLSNAFYLYLVSMILLYLVKPNFLFYNKGKKCLFKKFGCGKNKTVFSIHIISLVLAILMYIFMTCVNKLNI